MAASASSRYRRTKPAACPRPPSNTAPSGAYEIVSTETFVATSGATSLPGCNTFTPSGEISNAAGAGSAAIATTGASLVGSATDAAAAGASATTAGAMAAMATVAVPKICVPSGPIAASASRRGAALGAKVNKAANLPCLSAVARAVSAPSSNISTTAPGAADPATVALPSGSTRTTSKPGKITAGAATTGAVASGCATAT